MENCSRIKDGNRRQKLEWDMIQRIWKDYFQDLYDINIQEEVAIHMRGFMIFRKVTTLEESQLGRLK